MSEGLSQTREPDAPPAPVRVLIVDDETLFARAVEKRLAKEGYAPVVAGTLGKARHLLQTADPQIILLDVRLPDGSGLDFLSELRQHKAPELPVVVLSAYGEIEDAVAAMKLRASDYLKKPLDLDELLITLDKVLGDSQLARALEYSRAREHHAREEVCLLGQHPAIVKIRGQVERLGALCATAAAIPPTILILGETGTGKDLVARLLHSTSARRERPFVHVDCAALPKDLFEAELFGHEKGAFTTALTARTGLIEAAEDGVVFLDEIGELPVDLQSKLLAVLERRSTRRIGSTRERTVSAWFIAATNRDPEQMMAAGALRNDLYYRLNVLSIYVPPLRARADDAVALADHFARQVAKRYGLPAPTITVPAGSLLRAYSWPGNIRELKHLIERVVLLTGGGTVNAEDLMLPGLSGERGRERSTAIEGLTLAAAERLLIEQALSRTGNNVSETARQLGVTRMAIRYRMKKYGFLDA